MEWAVATEIYASKVVKKWHELTRSDKRKLFSLQISL